VAADGAEEKYRDKDLPTSNPSVAEFVDVRNRLGHRSRLDIVRPRSRLGEMCMCRHCHASLQSAMTSREGLYALGAKGRRRDDEDGMSHVIPASSAGGLDPSLDGSEVAAYSHQPIDLERFAGPFAASYGLSPFVRPLRCRSHSTPCIVDTDAVVLGPTPLVSETNPLIKVYNVLTSFQRRRRRPLERNFSLLVFEPK
jgi:hypothetical protein